jgi:DNA-binding NtrC family response regulator
VAFLPAGAPASPPPPALPLSVPSADAPWTLRRLTLAYAEHVLKQAGGDKQRAAQILDVDLSTLYRWQRADAAFGDKRALRSRRARQS